MRTFILTLQLALATVLLSAQTINGVITDSQGRPRVQESAWKSRLIPREGGYRIFPENKVRLQNFQRRFISSGVDKPIITKRCQMKSITWGWLPAVAYIKG